MLYEVITIPEIDSMVVETTGLRKVGDDVRVLVYTSEAGLLAQPGTMINNVPLSATRVTFAPTADDTIYALTYVIASGDASVLPGDLECTVSLNRITSYNVCYTKSLRLL